MEPGSQSFGAPTFVQSYPNSTATNLTVDTYSRTAILSLNGSDTPYFMRVYTEVRLSFLSITKRLIMFYI
jgi:hypothetical protein